MSPSTPPRPTPPVARRQPYSFVHLGRTFDDPFAWLQERDNPEVIAWLEEENQYARSHLDPLRPLHERLYGEMLARVQEDDESVPVRSGGWEYFTRTEKGKEYRRLFRRAAPTPGQPHPEEQLLLDENELAAGLAYCRILRAMPSPDHRRLAWLVDTTGAWVFELWIKDLTTGAMVAGPIANCAYSTAWAAQGESFFFTRFDGAHRSAEVLRLDLAGGEPVVVYTEEDEAFHVDIECTRSGGYIVATSSSATTSEVAVLPAARPQEPFRVIEPRHHWREYDVEHMPTSAAPAADDGHFLIRANDGGPNFRLLRAPVESPGRDHWEELLPHRPDTLLEEVHPFRTFIALTERSGGLQQLRLLDADGREQGLIPFPEELYTMSLGETQLRSGFNQNPDFDSPTLRLFYSSLVTPYSTIEYEVAAGQWQVRKVLQVPGYDPARYESHRLAAHSHDGAQVPLSIVHRRDLPMDGERPVLLCGYGAYGYSYDVDFDSTLIPLLDRGFVVAIAHVRGGSELGRDWYESGRLLHKANTFHDFIACAEALVARGVTRPGRIAATGGSAGGLLMGVVTNWRPDLWGAVVADVPFMNVITSMLMPELPLTVIEWEQWGNPAIGAQFDAMLAYSPYENLCVQGYPPLFVKAGLNDLQVPYWDPAKYVARLRTLSTGEAPLILRTNMGAGHSGASGRYARLSELAEEYAFIVAMLDAPTEPLP
jgi:oligopeptidase B